MINGESKYPCDIKYLQEKIGYTFKNPEYLLEALKHSSYTNEMRAKNIIVESNERFEFFGDSILEFAVGEYLFLTFPDFPEGELTKMRAELVCTDSLAGFAEEISLGDYLYLGKGEENGGRQKKKILENTYEALLAAIYLDGGIENVKKVLIPKISTETEKIVSRGSTRDHKSLLQQIVQQTPGELLEYVIISETGPQHNKVFECEARLNSNVIGRGTGKSKREAEQNAAWQALVWFGEKIEDGEK